MSENASEPNSALRLDKWLWYARFLKSRALATKAIENGGVRVSRNGKTDLIKKPSFAVRVGDIVTVPLAGRIAVLEVRALGERRGPASEAQELYNDLTPEQPRVKRTSPISAGRRPTKKDRRALDEFKGGGA